MGITCTSGVDYMVIAGVLFSAALLFAACLIGPLQPAEAYQHVRYTAAACAGCWALLRDAERRMLAPFGIRWVT